MEYYAGEPIRTPIPWDNLGEAFDSLARRMGSAPALYFPRHGVYGSLSWEEYRLLADALAAYWIDRGVEYGERVAVLSRNRLEWLIADISLLKVGAITVPLHVALSPDQIAFQLAHSETRRIVVGGHEEAEKLEQVLDRLPSARDMEVLSMEATDAPTRLPVGRVARWDVAIGCGLRRAAELAGVLAQRQRKPLHDTPATILYTSGTTGEPKGVVLTHGNFLANAVACLQTLGKPEAPLQLNWLPYSHVFARLADYYQPLLGGIPVALSRGMDYLGADLKLLRPTHMSTVPRFLEKVHRNILGLPEGERPRAARRFMGGRMAWAISGGAALPVAIAEDFQKWGVLILQGYGLTESSPVISVNTPQHNRPGSVGKPIAGVEVRIESDGEVLTRGPHVMAGYWRNPEATAATVRDGWLYTGDLGRLDEEGYLWILGRKKELIVLSTGKNVAPVAVESVLLKSPLIEQAVVVGDDRPYVAALIVPNFAEVRRRLGISDTTEATAQELVERSDVVELIGGAVEEANQQLATWERVRRFTLLPEPLAVERGELTPTLKVRRAVIQQRYAREIETLYA